ncbi:MAG: polysaccharide biosynthesis protein [Magnetococcales bacterium]|nr:polysaccharide biosynthesis protein [Magnetococcales bacterium]
MENSNKIIHHIRDLPNTVINKMPRKTKQVLLLLIDTFFIMLSVWGGFAVVEFVGKPSYLTESLWTMPLAVTLSLPLFARAGFYHAVIHQASDRFFIILINTCVFSVIILAVIVEVINPVHVPGMVWVVHGWILWVLVGGVRFAIRFLLSAPNRGIKEREAVAIYGAGAACEQILLALQQSEELQPVAIFDDKSELHGIKIRELQVYPSTEMIFLIKKLKIKRVLLSFPSASRYRRHQIIRFLESMSIHVQDIPNLNELADGSKTIVDIREISDEDLLGRIPVPPDQSLLKDSITGKAVLVTGAGGSIGSELCRQIIRLAPKCLVLVERTEFTLYSIAKELEELNQQYIHGELEIVSVLGSVRSYKRMFSVLKKYNIQTVYHAAAYKHVNIIELNPIEGFQNNIYGTYQMAKAAIAANVTRFVLISTDKAVRPTNVMGATKRHAELILQALAAENNNICFSMVRFGNVVASSGSVIPLFRQQIKNGGPVTVTHPEVNRFFMTIPEASQLVIQASAMAYGGDVFVLDMGQPIKILDLVKRMIQLSGLTIRNKENPDGDIAITITGLKPGEKLYEELLIGEHTSPTDHPMIIRVQEDSLPMAEMLKTFNELESASQKLDEAAVRKILMKIVEK